MGIRSRSLRFAISLAVLFATAALPEVWTSQIPGRPAGPGLAWAGGTPDETLKPTPPPKAPPKPARATASYVRVAPSGGATVETGRAGRVVGAWSTRWTVTWASVRVWLLRR
jgi:hypothetical protein